MILKVTQTSRFFKCVSPTGYQHTAFFMRTPLVDSFETSELTVLTGYISFCYLLCNGSPQGILFKSIRSRTEVKPYVLRVGIPDELPGTFEPLYILEKLGVLVFKAQDSSLIATLIHIDSSLLVKVE